jgi:hypothetical protein
MDSPSPSPAPAASPVPVSPAPPQRTWPLGRIFSVLLLIATVTSVLSTLAFIGYLALPAFSGQPRSHFTLLYGAGIAGLTIAEACQILGVVTLLVRWISPENVEKKWKELAVLIISLIPYMVAIIFLITLVVYLRARRQNPTSEQAAEAAEDLKDQTVNTFIDAAANKSNAMAASPTTPAARPSVARLSARPSMRDAVSQVVGPSTGRNVSDSAQGLLGFTAAALVISAIATAGVVLPAKGLAPLQPSQASVSSRHKQPTRVSGPVPVTWKVTISHCAPWAQYGAGSTVCGEQVPRGNPQTSFTWIITQQGKNLSITQNPGNFMFTGTLSGQKITMYDEETSIPLIVIYQFTGTVLTSNHMSGTATDIAAGGTGTQGGVEGGFQFDWDATRATP